MVEFVAHRIRLSRSSLDSFKSDVGGRWNNVAEWGDTISERSVSGFKCTHINGSALYTSSNMSVVGSNMVERSPRHSSSCICRLNLVLKFVLHFTQFHVPHLYFRFKWYVSACSLERHFPHRGQIGIVSKTIKIFLKGLKK